MMEALKRMIISFPKDYDGKIYARRFGDHVRVDFPHDGGFVGFTVTGKSHADEEILGLLRDHIAQRYGFRAEISDIVKAIQGCPISPDFEHFSSAAPNA